MNIKRGKSGQFYIIAALIIISVIIGFFAARNYLRTNGEGTKVYDLSRELKIETGYVYDYGTYNQELTDSLVEDWTERYYNYSKGQEAVEDWIFAYGDAENIIAITFTTVTVGEIGITTGMGTTPVKIEKGIKNKTEIPAQKGKISIAFKNQKYDFDLKTGENFFFVIKSGGYVSRG